MSTTATIVTLWEDVFNNASMTAISQNAYPYEVKDGSEFEISTMSEDQTIDYFEYLVTREVTAREVGGGSNAIFRFTVEVRYTKQVDDDTAGDSYAGVRDAFDTLLSVVESELGTTWDGNVDYYTHQDGPADIQAVRVADTNCYRGTYKFFGTQAASL